MKAARVAARSQSIQSVLGPAKALKRQANVAPKFSAGDDGTVMVVNHVAVVAMVNGVEHDAFGEVL
jgi:hypothetical protein